MLIALRMKGETAEEMIGAARALSRRRAAVRAARLSLRRLLRHRRRRVGADQRLDRDRLRRRGLRACRSPSTATAASARAAARPTCSKRSARRSTSRRRRRAALLDETGFCFLFAPAYHPGMKHAALVRRQLRSADDHESARPVHQSGAAAGAAARRRRSEDAPADRPDARRDGRRARRWSSTARGSTKSRCMAKRGRCACRTARSSELEITPEDAGLERAPLKVVTGGDVDENAARLQALLAGRGARAEEDIVILNTAALLHDGGQGRRPAAKARSWRARRCSSGAAGAGARRVSSRRAVAEPVGVLGEIAARQARGACAAASTACRSTRCAPRRSRRARSLAAALAQAGRALHPRDQEGVALGRRDPRRRRPGGARARLCRRRRRAQRAVRPRLISAARSTISRPRAREFDGPILAKDFFIDPRQVAEARIAGADAVLVMLSLLDDDAARAMIAEARRFGMDALVEVHDEAEMRRALALGAPLIGINNRDLRDLSDRSRDDRAAGARWRRDRMLVSESGIATPRRRRAAGAAGRRLPGRLVADARRRPGAGGARARVRPHQVVRTESRRRLARRPASGVRRLRLRARQPPPGHGRRSRAAGRTRRESGMLPGRRVPRRAAARRSPTSRTLLNLHAVQLHGREDAEYVRALRRELPADVRDLDGARASGASRWRGRGGDRLLFDNGDGGSGRSVRLVADRAAIPSSPTASSPAGSAPHNARAAQRLGAYAIDVGSAVDAAARAQVAGEDRGACSTRCARRRASGCAHAPERPLRPLRRLLCPGDPGARRSSSSRRAFLDAQDDPAFAAELNDLLANYAGRPTPLTRCRNLPRQHLSEARGPAPRRRAQDQPGARRRACSPGGWARPG